MAIRTNTNPRAMDLQPEMRDILMRNGLQAHIAFDGGGYKLIVQGHDSPLLTYQITEKQLLALTDWGTNTANKKAYNVLTSILAKDFYLPKNFVHARNANGRVAMGLHGYRIGMGEYGRTGRWGLFPPILGWTPRQQGGFHLRRVGGQLFFPGAPIVPERPDGRMKPGELQSGGYGFYYKGGQPEQPVQPRDVLQDLQAAITPMVSRPRSQEPARPYRELVASPVYFSNEKWSECLASHGLIVDAENRTLTVQSENVNADMVYDLTEEEIKTLTSNSLEEHSIEQRLELLNGVIAGDFADKVTLDDLNSDKHIAIGLHPEVHEELTAREQNYGLAKNVIEGVTAIVNKYGKVIVLEDDLVTNRYFLLFMNDGLDRYQNEQKVTGITGFSHFGDTFSYPCESYFNTLSGTSWSWATWSDRWKYFDADCDDWTDMVSDKKLRKAFNYDNTYDFYKIMKMQKTDEKTNSWAIRWYWTNFRKQGLILSPTKSLVSNEGWDGTGIHCGNEKGPVFDHKLMTDHRITEFPQEICEKPELHKAMKKALIHESQPNLIKRIYHVVFRKNYIGQA